MGESGFGVEEKCEKVKDLDCPPISSTSKVVYESENISVDLANQLPNIDPRMAGILHNLQNSGNITINFNFDRK